MEFDTLGSQQDTVGIQRLVATEETPLELDNTEVQDLRPHTFEDYPGQDRVKDNLKVYIHAALKRGEPLDHLILHGPPGLGKTTLARIVAGELGVPFYQTSGPNIDKAGDLAGLLAGVEPGSVVFIDEIHRLSIAVEEMLYSAMEDFSMDIIVGQGPTSRSVKMPISPFTLIGATTRMSLLSSPFRSRFGIQERLEFYSPAALAKILQRSAKILNVELCDDGALEIASRSRGTPRVANRLLRRSRDFCAFFEASSISANVADKTLGRLEIDGGGLDKMDRRLLAAILHQYQGGPVGLDALAATIGEERSTLEEVYEPYLMHQGLLIRGPRGREISKKGREHMGALQAES